MVMDGGTVRSMFEANVGGAGEAEGEVVEERKGKRRSLTGETGNGDSAAGHLRTVSVNEHQNKSLCRTKPVNTKLVHQTTERTHHIRRDEGALWS